MSSCWAVGQCCWWRLFWQEPSPSARCFSLSPLYTVTRKSNTWVGPQTVLCSWSRWGYHKPEENFWVSRFHRRQLQVLACWTGAEQTTHYELPGCLVQCRWSVWSLNELFSFFISRMWHQETSAYGWLILAVFIRWWNLCPYNHSW